MESSSSRSPESTQEGRSEPTRGAPRRRRPPGGNWLASLGFVLAIVAPILAFIVAIVLFGQERTRAGFGVIGVALLWLSVLFVAYVNGWGQ